MQIIVGTESEVLGSMVIQTGFSEADFKGL